MVRIQLVAKFTVVVLGHAPHAVAPRSGDAQVDLISGSGLLEIPVIEFVENFPNLFFRAGLQQFGCDGAGHPVAFKTPRQCCDRIQETEQTAQQKANPEHEPPRPVTGKRCLRVVCYFQRN